VWINIAKLVGIMLQGNSEKLGIPTLQMDIFGNVGNFKDLEAYSGMWTSSVDEFRSTQYKPQV